MAQLACSLDAQADEGHLMNATLDPRRALFDKGGLFPIPLLQYRGALFICEIVQQALVVGGQLGDIAAETNHRFFGPTIVLCGNVIGERKLKASPCVVNRVATVMKNVRRRGTRQVPVLDALVEPVDDLKVIQAYGVGEPFLTVEVCRIGEHAVYHHPWHELASCFSFSHAGDPAAPGGAQENAVEQRAAEVNAVDASSGCPWERRKGLFCVQTGLFSSLRLGVECQSQDRRFDRLSSGFHPHPIEGPLDEFLVHVDGEFVLPVHGSRDERVSSDGCEVPVAERQSLFWRPQRCLGLGVQRRRAPPLGTMRSSAWMDLS